MYGRSRADKNRCSQKSITFQNKIITEPQLYKPYLLPVKFQKPAFYQFSFMRGQRFVLSILYLPLEVKLEPSVSSLELLSDVQLILGCIEIVLVGARVSNIMDLMDFLRVNNIMGFCLVSFCMDQIHKHENALPANFYSEDIFKKYLWFDCRQISKTESEQSLISI